jgi:peptidoglycan/LPS O-acetylase OafA/YrhL
MGTKQTEERHHALDLLRGSAALGIATYHYLLFYYGIDLLSLGIFGVYLFFTLSGLTMMLVYGRTFVGSIAVADVKSFYWNRISRILPLLCAVALANFLIILIRFSSDSNWHFVLRSAAKAFMTGLGLFALHLPAYLSNSIGAWSLGIEIFFYFVFPIICLISNVVAVRSVVFVTCLLILGQQIVLALLQEMIPENNGHFWDYYSVPLTFSPFFMLGILIYQLPGQRRYLNLLWSACGLGAIIAYSSVLNINVFTSNLHYLALTGLTFVSVLFAYRSNLHAALFGPASFLGNISYALYLTHPFSFSLAQRITAAIHLGARVQAIICLAVAISIAYCSFEFFERPARGFLRRMNWKMANTGIYAVRTKLRA